MKLLFCGKTPERKYIRMGVAENNNVDELTLVIGKVQGNVNLADFEPFIKITNRDLSYADKTNHFNYDADSSDESIFITCKMPAKVTRQKNVDMQVIFEKAEDTDVLVWQSQIFNVAFDATLNVTGIIEKEYPDVLQDYGERITVLEGKGGITECIDSEHFPEQGEANVIYIDLSDGTQYIYDAAAEKYVIVGFNPETIKIINCNGGL